MLDFFRNLTKSAEEKRQEQIQAYVSDSLTAVEKQQFEAELAQDADLKDEVDSLLQLRQAMRSMPQRRARRSFALDPAVYGKPEPQRLGQFYPMVRAATALTAVFLVIALGAEFFTPSSEPVASFPTVQQESAESVAMSAEDAGDDSAADEEMAEMEMEEALFEEEAADEDMAEEVMSDEAADAGAPPAEGELLEFAAPEAAPEDGDDSAMDSAVIESTPPPQPTVDTPRIEPTPTLDSRALESDEVAGFDSLDTGAVTDAEGEETAVAELNEELALNQSRNAETETTAIDQFNEPSASSNFTALRLAQIGLAVILVGLLMLLRAARMQRKL